jgi:hypothetical protein
MVCEAVDVYIPKRATPAPTERLAGSTIDWCFIQPAQNATLDPPDKRGIGAPSTCERLNTFLDRYLLGMNESFKIDCETFLSSKKYLIMENNSILFLISVKSSSSKKVASSHSNN